MLISWYVWMSLIVRSTDKVPRDLILGLHARLTSRQKKIKILCKA